MLRRTLGLAFMEECQLDNGLVPSKIVSVLQESPLKELFEKPRPESPNNVSSLTNAQTECFRNWSLVTGVLETETPDRSSPERQPRPTTRGQKDAGGEGLRAALLHPTATWRPMVTASICPAAMEAWRWRTAPSSLSNMPWRNTFQSYLMTSSSGLNSGDGFLGQDVTGKPPNVLVYTGGCEERFQMIRVLLAECIDIDSYVVYPLRPQQVPSEPWMQNTKLLVLAEEGPLTPQLQACFLNYMGLGGRVLGLCSTFCPAGLQLEARERPCGQISRLSFSRENNTDLELSLLASGKVFVRDSQGGGEVELWGELKGEVQHGEKDVVIIRLAHGEGRGEAILCQVHLETTPDSQEVTSEGFDELKFSNARRYKVLTEILSSLGLSCELNQVPPPSPVYVFSTSEENKTRFLKWLRGHTDSDGSVRSSKAPLRLVSGADHQTSLPEGTLALVTEPSESLRLDQFSLDTYRKHLQTQTLGRTLLYTEVTPTTMDLLEGLVQHLPAQTGLIAIAARQSQGRGRGGNAWLSPLGCASFTLNIQVESRSRLGQRISFLQHLASLAVVEAVRTLPGYQDIDMRLKWPNDIYYSNLMKLGGVLVTSTVSGPTIHLLVGCGFNVSNSNPTICVNDLLAQHNREHGTSLEALSPAQLIARIVTSLEDLVSAFQRGGPEAVLPTYYKRWLHGGTRVRLWSKDGPEAAVVGLDDSGFLQVYCKERGVVSLEPDGNSFDMMANLVVRKPLRNATT